MRARSRSFGGSTAYYIASAAAECFAGIAAVFTMDVTALDALRTEML